MNDKRLEQRVAAVAESALSERGFVTAIDVFLGLGWLSPSDEQAWRQGRTPYLEKVVTANLSKIATAMRCFRAWARGRGLKPSETVYVARSRGRRTLRFSKSGTPSIESAYRTHWVSPGLSERKRERLAERQNKPPELVVISPVRDWTCAGCGGTGDLLIMEEPGPLCLACADMDHLVFLAAGDAALTRRARAASTLSAVVVRFSRARMLDGDEEAIVALLGGDLSSPHQFIQVCEAMAELGRDDEVLAWAKRGIAETSGWQVEKLYDFACGVHERRSALLEVLRLRREQHEGMASASTYSRLRDAADEVGAWDIERDAARLALRERDLGWFIDALLTEGDVEEAWCVANEDPDWEPGLAQRISLAEACEPQHPEQALPWYMLAADEMLIETGRRAYARAIPVLKNARRAAEAAGQSEWFTARVAELREHHRRRPTLIAMLDKAGIG